MANESSNDSYTISQAAALTGQTEDTLRYWERTFPEILSPERRTSNHRRYSAKDIEAIRRLHFLLHVRHLTAEGARAVFASQDLTTEDVAWVQHRLDELIESVRQLQNFLVQRAGCRTN